MAVVIRSAEIFVPSPSAWLRFGLANSIALMATVIFGFRVWLIVTILCLLLETVPIRSIMPQHSF